MTWTEAEGTFHIGRQFRLLTKLHSIPNLEVFPRDNECLSLVPATSSITATTTGIPPRSGARPAWSVPVSKVI